MSDSVILSVDAGGTFLKAALSRPDGSLLSGTFLRVPVDSNGTAEEISAAYRSLARQAGERADLLGGAISAAAVCIPGPFRYEDGVCMMTHKYAGIYGIPMRPWFQEFLGEIPITFLHDSTAFLLGAAGEDDRRHYRRICGAIIGTGLGFASMIDGKILQNAQGGPGISIFSRPFRESTAEDYVSKRAIEHSYHRLRPDTPVPSVAEIAESARAGDPCAQRAFSELGDSLGLILRDICAENRFELLLLGGAISKSADLFLPSLQAAMSGRWSPEIRAVSNADDVPLFGAVKAASGDF